MTATAVPARIHAIVTHVGHRRDFGHAMTADGELVFIHRGELVDTATKLQRGITVSFIAGPPADGAKCRRALLVKEEAPCN